MSELPLIEEIKKWLQPVSHNFEFKETRDSITSLDWVTIRNRASKDMRVKVRREQNSFLIDANGGIFSFTGPRARIFLILMSDQYINDTNKEDD
jgi:hypothetical protein